MPSRDESISPASALFATASKPFAWFNFAASGAATKALGSVSALTSTGADHATRAGWLTLNGSSQYYTAPTYLEAALQAAFDLGQNALLLTAQVNVLTGADTAQDYLLHVGTGVSSNYSWVVQRSSTASSGQICTHYLNAAFDSDSAASGYSGGANAFTVNADTNLALLIDNRSEVKRVYQYANGVQFGTAVFPNKGACTYASAPTKRLRIGGTAAGSPTNLYLGALRRFGAWNFGTSMPSNINQVIHSMHQSNCIPTLALLRSLQ
jgi:hypothetical protein